MQSFSIHLQSFAKAGLGEAASILGSVGIGTINVLVTIVAIFVVDKIDRKNYLLVVILV